MLQESELRDILERCGEWLEETRDEINRLESVATDLSADGSDRDGAARSFGMWQLVEAVTALRHELKLQTKSTRGLEDSVRHSLTGMNQAGERFQSVKVDQVETATQAARPFVEALIDLDESLSRAAASFPPARAISADRALVDRLIIVLDEQFQQLPAWRRVPAGFWRAQVKQILGQQRTVDDQGLRSFVDGIRLIRDGMNRTLASLDIERIECLNRRVDPTLMRVVELVEAPGRMPETVLEEVRPGYLWRESVVRYAEVRAVRPPDKPMD